jgi:hypothetical protein
MIQNRPEHWFVDCQACGGTGEIGEPPGNGCAICLTTGYLPWNSFRRDRQTGLVDRGIRPWYFVRTPVSDVELGEYGI